MAVKQNVYLEIWDEPTGGKLVLDASELRVDFDVRLIPEFSRATFTIWNLNEVTIASLMDGDRYVTLKTQLHDGRVDLIADRFFISNVVDELNLPNRMTTLYCFDRIRKDILEKQVSVEVKGYPALRTVVDELLVASDYGYTEESDFRSFPDGILYEANKKAIRMINGSAQQVLRRLEKEYKFVTYTSDGRLIFMHKPNLGGVDRTSLFDKQNDFVLSTSSMRSNPKISIASCSIHNNLDGRIKPTMILDLSELLTIGTSAGQGALELVDKYVRNFSNYSKYQAFAITHTGSNYTADWSTRITGLSPTYGKLMPTVLWAGKTN